LQKNIKRLTDFKEKIMALIKCPECSKEVSDKAAICPNCAYPINQPKQVVSDTKQSEVEDYIKNGEVFLSLKEWDKAYKQFEKATEIAPADWRGWFGLVKVTTFNLTQTFFEYDDLYGFQPTYAHDGVWGEYRYNSDYSSGYSGNGRMNNPEHFSYLKKSLAVANEQDKQKIRKLYNAYGKTLAEMNFDMAKKNIVGGMSYYIVRGYVELIEEYGELIDPAEAKRIISEIECIKIEEEIKRAKETCHKRRLEIADYLEKAKRSSSLDDLKILLSCWAEKVNAEMNNEAYKGNGSFSNMAKENAKKIANQLKAKERLELRDIARMLTNPIFARFLVKALKKKGIVKMLEWYNKNALVVIEN